MYFSIKTNMFSLGNMTSDLGKWLVQIPIAIRDMDESEVWFVMLITTIICIIVVAKVYHLHDQYNVTYEKNVFEGHDLDEETKKYKRNCEALKMIEAIHYNLYFRGYRAMILEKYPADFTRDGLQSTMNFLVEMKKKHDMTYRLKIKEMEFPLIRDLIDEEKIPDEVDLEDAVALTLLIIASLGFFQNDLTYGETIYPVVMEKRMDEVKKKIKELAELTMLVLEACGTNASKNLVHVLRIAKLMIIEHELEQLESLMKKKTREFIDFHRRHPRPIQAGPYNAPAQAGPYNALAQAGPYNALAQAGPYNVPVQAGPYNALAQAGPYNAPAQAGPYNVPAQAGPYNALAQAGPYNALAQAGPSNVRRRRGQSDIVVPLYL